MDPVSVLISALVAGASAALTETTQQTIKDAYGGLKRLILRRAHSSPLLEEAIGKMEQTPRAEPAQESLRGVVVRDGVQLDEEIVAAALALLRLTGESDSSNTDYRAALHGDGALAQGPGAVAAGAGGVAVDGNVHGNVTVSPSDRRRSE